MSRLTTLPRKTSPQRRRAPWALSVGSSASYRTCSRCSRRIRQSWMSSCPCRAAWGECWMPRPATPSRSRYPKPTAATTAWRCTRTYRPNSVACRATTSTWRDREARSTPSGSPSRASLSGWSKPVGRSAIPIWPPCGRRLRGLADLGDCHRRRSDPADQLHQQCQPNRHRHPGGRHRRVTLKHLARKVN